MSRHKEGLQTEIYSLGYSAARVRFERRPVIGGNLEPEVWMYPGHFMDPVVDYRPVEESAAAVCVWRVNESSACWRRDTVIVVTTFARLSVQAIMA